MKVGISTEADAALSHLCGVVNQLNVQLAESFAEKQYGPDVENIFVVIILTSPESNRLHSVRKLKYLKSAITRIGKLTIEHRNVIEYDIRPDFDTVSELDAVQARKYLAGLLVESVTLIAQGRDKYPSFDVAQFTRDWAACLT